MHYKAWLVGARQKQLEVGTNTSIQTGRHMLYPLSHHFIKPKVKKNNNKPFQHRGKNHITTILSYYNLSRLYLRDCTDDTVYVMRNQNVT